LICIPFSKNIFHDFGVAEALLEFLESGQVIVNTRALDRLTDLQCLPGFPILLRLILLDLVANSVVDEANFFASDFENMRVFIKIHHLMNILESAPH